MLCTFFGMIIPPIHSAAPHAPEHHRAFGAHNRSERQHHDCHRAENRCETDNSQQCKRDCDDRDVLALKLTAARNEIALLRYIAFRKPHHVRDTHGVLQPMHGNEGCGKSRHDGERIRKAYAPAELGEVARHRMMPAQPQQQPNPLLNMQMITNLGTILDALL